jgi:glutathione synthase/RimK-type ligase-like ATP-grasp enzyme
VDVRLQGADAQEERIRVNDLDVLLLRNDPADDAGERPWAQTSSVLFGQLAVRNGVVVLNDPFSLANAINKTARSRTSRRRANSPATMARPSAGIRW